MADLASLDFKVGALEQQLSDLKRTYESAVARLQEQLALVRSSPGGASGASGAVAVLGNRVEWTITGISEKLANMVKGQSVYSDGFDVLGLKGIQLEFYPRGRQTESGAFASEDFCSVFLWCPPGSHIRYFLFCGKYCRAPDEDQFDARMGHGHSNFCVLNDQIVNDSVVIGVEILEVHQKSLDLAPDLKIMWKSIREVIREEMEVFNNQAVDRVEWQIKDVSKVKKCWPKGSSLFSPLFTAAGVRDILFEFYPNGSAVTQNEGYCGFYIRCPDGTSVTLTLFVGQSRKGPISARFESATGKGLPDFCALEDQIDKVSDSVTVGIEIRNNDLPPSKTLRL
jgi:hypothetical protein